MSSASIYPLETVESRLVRLFREATQEQQVLGLSWYSAAHNLLEVLALNTGVNIRTVCGICAALSPGSEWNRNIRDTQTFLENQNALVGVYGRGNRIKAQRILDGEDPLDVLGTNPRFPKTRSFFLNIAYPAQDLAITIDRHIKCAAYNITEDRDKNSIVSVKERIVIEESIRAIAKHYGLLPHQVQAVIWLIWKSKVEKGTQQ